MRKKGSARTVAFVRLRHPLRPRTLTTTPTVGSLAAPSTGTPSTGTPSTVARAAGLVVGAGLIAGLCAAPALADPTPTTTPAPTLASVTAQLADLGRQNEQLTEQFNAATADVAAKQQAATAAQTAADQAVASWQAALKLYGSTIVEQYKQGTLSKAGALLGSSSSQNYLDTVSDLSTVSRHNSVVVDKLDAAHDQAVAAQTAAGSALAQATATRDAVAKQKSDLDAQQTKYKALLTSLTPVQQTTFFSKTSAAVPADFTVHAGSAAAQTAIDFALAQRGKPYRYAASGPSAYDCSGLTMAAWAAAGVSLPHNAAAQYRYGTHVSLSALEPGDLVFFYSPIGHVGIYLGNGLIVHAPTEGDVVKISPIFSGAVGATRLT